MKYGHPNFYLLLEIMAAIHSAKNHDYASTDDPLRNFRECENFGVDTGKGIMVRMSDKWSRLTQFEKTGQLLVHDEGFLDTLIDLANYCLLRAIVYTEQHPEALERLVHKWLERRDSDENSNQ